MNLRVVFFGTPDIAAQVLESLLHLGVNIVAVVSRVDKPQKRSKTPQPSPVKLVAQKHTLPLLQPVKASDPIFAEELRAFAADVFVVVAYGAILKTHILEMPPFGCINLHGSLLPDWRGAAPAQRAIMNGDKVSGVTVIQMNEGMDTGDMLGKRSIDILPDMTSGELLYEMGKIGAPLLFETLQHIEAGTIVPIRQPEQGSLAPKITKEDGFVSWQLSAEDTYNQIRGVSPFPGAWCFIGHPQEELKKRLLIKTARLGKLSHLSPGQVLVENNCVFVGCSQGCLQLVSVQLEGKNPSPAANALISLLSKGQIFL